MANLEIKEPLSPEQIKTLSDFARTQADVFIRRESGKMQKGKVHLVMNDERHVMVTFYDERNPIKELQKIVDGEDLLVWQEDGKAEADALDDLDTAIAKHVAKEASVAIQPVSDEITSEHQETHNGLPVLTEFEYKRLYRTDIRALGEEGAATFDFQGFVKYTDEGKIEYNYLDRMATNGVLRDKDQAGIHVGTDGIVDYNDIEGNHQMQSGKEVGEYDIYIEIPLKLQEKLGVVCMGDSCFSVESYEENFGETAQEFYEENQDKRPEHIVVRLMIDPKKDPEARKKVQLLHQQIIRYLEQGRPADELVSFIRNLENRLRDNPYPVNGNLLEA